MPTPQNCFENLLAFKAEGHRHGVLLEHIAGVLRAVALDKVIKTPLSIRGCIGLRGKIVSMLNTRAWSGLTRIGVEPSDRFIAVRARACAATLRVDGARGLMNVDMPVAASSPAAAEYPHGIARSRHESLTHTLEAFLSQGGTVPLDEDVVPESLA
jgi:chemotaxis signal transduction protein